MYMKPDPVSILQFFFNAPQSSVKTLESPIAQHGETEQGRVLMLTENYLKVCFFVHAGDGEVV